MTTPQEGPPDKCGSYINIESFPLYPESGFPAGRILVDMEPLLHLWQRGTNDEIGKCIFRDSEPCPFGTADIGIEILEQIHYLDQPVTEGRRPQVTKSEFIETSGGILHEKLNDLKNGAAILDRHATPLAKVLQDTGMQIPPEEVLKTKENLAANPPAANFADVCTGCRERICSFAALVDLQTELARRKDEKGAASTS